ncbi:cold-shock protein [Nocardia sp. NPDC056952]|uniref:cold-shock protein n=1 Tax=Nocardia sp. NPDC056952 TaxID=3345979 RepID=UPI00363FEA85
MLSTGKVVRFDEMKGYGFIASDSGNEQVFFHVNETSIDESAVRPGLRVVFDARSGDRGKYAVNVESSTEDSAIGSGDRPQLSREILLDEFTELIITCAPDVSGREVALFRRGFIALAEKHGWIDSSAVAEVAAVDSAGSTPVEERSEC